MDLEDVIAKLRKRVRSEKKLDWFNEIEAFFESQSEILEELLPDRGQQYVSISFDRRKNDKNFDYAFADILLKAIDLAQDGKGVRKPVNQLRIIRWQNTRRSLRALLIAAKGAFPQFKYRGVLTLPYRPVGEGLDPSFMQIP